MGVRAIAIRLERAYRRMENSWCKLLIKNAMSLLIHRFSIGVEEVTIDGVVIKLCRNRLMLKEQLVVDVAGYNLCRKPGLGDVVVDAGAYTGLYTVYCAKKVGTAGKVIAFEPDIYNFMMLRRNLRLNQITNTVCLRDALFDRDSVQPFDVQGFGSHIIASSYSGKVLNRTRTTTLDAALARLNVKKVDLVKMDVEGAEIEACRGCVATIHSNTSLQFAVASYHLINGRNTSSAIEEFFRAHGMRSFSLYPQHLTTYGCKP